ncbi:hypothetical protein ACHQM5_006716 [Ranunculus cassubicifolius]
MSSMLLPMWVIQKMEGIIKALMWGRKFGTKKLHYFGWDIATISKWMGGLGIRKLKEFNEALFSKKVWELLTLEEENSSLWHTNMKARYFPKAVE